MEWESEKPLQGCRGEHEDGTAALNHSDQSPIRDTPLWKHPPYASLLNAVLIILNQLTLTLLHAKTIMTGLSWLETLVFLLIHLTVNT